MVVVRYCVAPRFAFCILCVNRFYAWDRQASVVQGYGALFFFLAL